MATTQTIGATAPGTTSPCAAPDRLSAALAEVEALGISVGWVTREPSSVRERCFSLIWLLVGAEDMAYLCGQSARGLACAEARRTLTRVLAEVRGADVRGG